MRQQVNTRSSFFLKQNNTRDLTIEQLRRAFEADTPEAKAVLNSVVRYSGSLQGTRAYWSGRRHQLESFVRALGCPALFLTFSAADLHWNSLQRHMPRYAAFCAADNRGKIAIARQNLKENPHIAAYHFHQRFESFIQHVLKPKFNIVEYWYRYEWQARGSTHAHGLFWIQGAPNLENVPTLSLEVIRNREFLDFWGSHISSINPKLGQEQPHRDIDPLINMIANPTFDDLATVINRVQRHECAAAYCQRHTIDAQGRRSMGTYCRFHFPRTIHNHPVLNRDWNPQFPIYDGAHNDT
jgi:hypothetical protein